MFANVTQLFVKAGHDFFEAGKIGLCQFLFGQAEGLRGTDTGNHIFALGVDQIFAVVSVFAGGRVTGEANAGGAVIAHVAKHHGLNVDSRAPMVGQLVQFTIRAGARVHPAAEDGADGAPKLLPRILREGRAGHLNDLGFVILDHDFQIVAGQFGVELVAVLGFVLFKNGFEVVVIDVEHHVAVHLNEAAIAVIGEANVARRFGQRFDGLGIEAEVQHRIHHAGHGSARAGTNRQQQRHFGAVELAFHDVFKLGNGRADLILQFARIGFAVVVVVRADFGGYGEPRRHRRTNFTHFAQVGTLAAQQIAQFLTAVCGAATKAIYPFSHICFLPFYR